MKLAVLLSFVWSHSAKAATLSSPNDCANRIASEWDASDETDAIFRVTPRAVARVVFELQLTGPLRPVHADPFISSLHARDIDRTIYAAPAWASQHSEWLTQQAENGAEIGVLFLSEQEFPFSQAQIERMPPRHWWAVLKQARRTLRKSSHHRIESIATDTLPPAAEIALEEMGFRVISTTDPVHKEAPRPARGIDGTRGQALIITSAPYADQCGVYLPSFHPGALDRATRATQQGGVVRIGVPLSTEPDRSQDLRMWNQWLTDIVTPSPWRTLTASDAARQPAFSGAFIPPPPKQESRQVAVEVPRILAAAEDAVASSKLPRVMGDDIYPIELFIGLVALLSEGTTAGSVPLVQAIAPIETARSTLPALGVQLPDKDIVATAQLLHGAMGAHIPTVLNVGNTTLTAGEFLVAMSLVALGRPTVIQPIQDPDPFATGGGWGEVRGL